MIEKIQREQEIIKSINIEIDEIKNILIGNKTEDVPACDIQIECLDDMLNKNLNDLKYALDKILIVKKEIIGGER